MYIKWSNSSYKLVDDANIETSSKEVSFSDLKIDFTGCTVDNLPYYLQECSLFDENNKVIYTGYVENYTLPELTNANEIYTELSLTLMSPRKLTSKRITTIIDTDTLTNMINRAIDPLIEDGFNIKAINVPNKTITLNLISETVEDILNYLSSKYSLWWFIDENKNIYIYSIDYLFNYNIKKDINIENYKNEINGLISILPSVENSDYANIINVKNARIFYEKNLINQSITLSNGGKYTFENPIDISLATAKRIANSETDILDATIIIYNLDILYNDNSEAGVYSAFNTNPYAPGTHFENIGIDDTSNSLFVLELDSTFKNLATSIIYKGSGSITINKIYSQTYLKYANMKLLNNSEIEKYQGIVTPSGKIEKQVDLNEGWYTINELINYVRSLFTNNNKLTNQVVITYDEKNDLKIGDRLYINLPQYFINDNFIVTSISESMERNNDNTYKLTLKSTNLLDNYVDLFKSSLDTEQQTSQVETEYLVEYIDGESIVEVHEEEVKQSVENYGLNNTLNLELRG